MNVLSFSEVGGHRHNEDSFVVEQHTDNRECWLCFLADGQGGQSGGGLASQLACRIGSETANTYSNDQLLDPLCWATILKTVDNAVLKDQQAGYCTFIGMCLFRDQLVGVSCGDSAALLVGKNGAREVTSVQQKNPPIGSGGALPVTFEAETDASCQILVMSDGVWKYVGMERITSLAQQLRGENLVEELQQLARLLGSGAFQDDFTIVVMDRSSSKS